MVMVGIAGAGFLPEPYSCDFPFRCLLSQLSFGHEAFEKIT